MVFPEIPLAQGVIEWLKVFEIKTIVISPGSRNAPLTIGFSENNYFTCYSIVDERCAAFFALGIAQQTQHPVALVCTSGSALLNYYPAIAEAFYSQIPLIILSADRPLHKIDIGDGQTIRQQNVFENHSLFNANLTEDWSTSNSDLIAEAIESAIYKKGPVHINIPFEEPLYNTVTNRTATITPRYTTPLHAIVPQREWNECVDIWDESPKKMILIGVNPPDSISQEIIEQWESDSSVIVFTEVTSNIREASFINCIDQLITPFNAVDFENFKPDLLITFGGMIVSKRIKNFLRKHPPTAHWHIDTLRAYDTYSCLTKHIQITPELFFNEIYARTNGYKKTTYKASYLKIKNDRLLKHHTYLNKCTYSDLSVFQLILTHLPKSHHLQISNSSAIRYAQLFEIDPNIHAFCNRGTSGIDGSTATAIGAAVGSQKPTVLITGDISFFYDSNALWNTYIPTDFKIIIINNSGGGIFRILPGHQETPTFNTFFETQHQLNASHLAKMYGFNYLKATTLDTVSTHLKTFFQIKEPTILEIFTPTVVNDKDLLGYFEYL